MKTFQTAFAEAIAQQDQATVTRLTQLRDAQNAVLKAQQLCLAKLTAFNQDHVFSYMLQHSVREQLKRFKHVELNPELLQQTRQDAVLKDDQELVQIIDEIMQSTPAQAATQKSGTLMLKNDVDSVLLVLEQSTNNELLQGIRNAARSFGGSYGGGASASGESVAAGSSAASASSASGNTLTLQTWILPIVDTSVITVVEAEPGQASSILFNEETVSFWGLEIACPDTNPNNIFTKNRSLDAILKRDSVSEFRKLLNLARQIEIELNKENISELSVAQIFSAILQSGSAPNCLSLLIEKNSVELAQEAPDFKERIIEMALLSSNVNHNYSDAVALSFRGNEQGAIQLVDRVLADPKIAVSKTMNLIRKLFNHQVLNKENVSKILQEYIAKYKAHSARCVLDFERNDHKKVLYLISLLYEYCGLTDYAFTPPAYQCASKIYDPLEEGSEPLTHYSSLTAMCVTASLCVSYARLFLHDGQFSSAKLFNSLFVYRDGNVFDKKQLYNRNARFFDMLAMETSNKLTLTNEQNAQLAIAKDLNTILYNIFFPFTFKFSGKSETAELLKKIVVCEAQMNSPSVMKQFFFEFIQAMVNGVPRLKVSFSDWKKLKESYIAAVKQCDVNGKVKLNLQDAHETVLMLETFIHPDDPSRAVSAASSAAQLEWMKKEKSAHAGHVSASASAATSMPVPTGEPQQAASSSSVTQTPSATGYAPQFFPPAASPVLATSVDVNDADCDVIAPAAPDHEPVEEKEILLPSVPKADPDKTEAVASHGF